MREKCERDLLSFRNTDDQPLAKGWLRVSTPLLYNVVVLRSTLQAKALVRTLKSSFLPGTFIKELRVEGAFGQSMRDVLKTDLWLPMRVWSTDSVTGLCRSLPLVDPRRLILSDNHPGEDTANSHKLREAICGCIRKWKRLPSVSFPDISPSSREYVDVDDFSAALSEVKPLAEIMILEARFDCSTYDYTDDQAMTESVIKIITDVARNPSLEAIHLESRYGYVKDASEQLLRDERANRILHFAFDDVDK
ncbi:hypothetical protein H0H87_005956 [Tephrocybe sp. NHM501043]|nr:hypothetical protein H0H87_005956 [Tephrocybe sp. NHM501043]